MTKIATDLNIRLEEAEARAVAAAKLAFENEQWARKNEALLDLAVKREGELATRIKQLTRSLANLGAWAESGERKLAAAKTTAAGLKTWAEDAEQRATIAQTRATEFEQWAKKSDEMLATANEKITLLEKYLNDHREWALRCEAELAQLKSHPKEPVV